MKTLVRPNSINATAGDGGTVAALNRQNLRDAGVFTVSVFGGPGCGKSTLIDRSIERLMPRVHVGVITGELRAEPGGGPVQSRTSQLVQVNADGHACLEPEDVGEALRRLDLDGMDLLFIENVGSLAAAAEQRDLGQEAVVTVFSVAAGDDKPRKHPDLVRAADVVLLSKTDLLPLVPFDVEAFRAAVRSAKSGVPLFEVSSLSGSGMTRWIEWLERRVRAPRQRGQDDASHWFG